MRAPARRSGRRRRPGAPRAPPRLRGPPPPDSRAKAAPPGAESTRSWRATKAPESPPSAGPIGAQRPPWPTGRPASAVHANRAAKDIARPPRRATSRRPAPPEANPESRARPPPRSPPRPPGASPRRRRSRQGRKSKPALLPANESALRASPRTGPVRMAREPIGRRLRLRISRRETNRRQIRADRPGALRHCAPSMPAAAPASRSAPAPSRGDRRRRSCAVCPLPHRRTAP
ncbi:MAG: hypothetical protein BWZ10_01719 [candidate division BRC1 bacterium ADurb.BinA364]|nr:MAG: hypothetical protein BWZ10_01719 [candidate division BRC1 bacterium ADurb.BinA364]